MVSLAQSEMRAPYVAIVDYELGNLFSVKRACELAGLTAVVTSSKSALSGAAGAVLPGVGAFGDAMETLTRLDLVSPLRDFIASGKPFFGICLGVQLLMSESHEFGRHRGLGVVPGMVVRLQSGPSGNRLKVPHIGWERIYGATGSNAWEGSLLGGLADGVYMYFVHSYVVQPEDESLVCSTSMYGDGEFCSSVNRGNLFGSQFHPERSGPEGLRMYANFAAKIKASLAEQESGIR